MLMNFFFFFTTTTLLLLAIQFQDGHACSFAPDYAPNITTQYDDHAYVFAGTVNNVVSGDDQNIPKNITLEVTRIWKNNDAVSLVLYENFAIETAANGALCGIEANMDEDWIIFAYANGWVSLKPNASVRDNNCATRQALDEIVSEALLGNGADCVCDYQCNSGYCKSANNKCTNPPNNRHLRSSFLV